MKKISVLLLCACLFAAALCALAEGNPFDSGVQEAIQLQISGNAVLLDFDRSEEYSAVADGNVQASFYAYSDNSENLYELYMVFPEGVSAGDTITPEYASQYDPDCSVVLIITVGQQETYYFAGQIGNDAYPNTSSYAMRFESVYSSGGDRVYSGYLTASMMGMDMDSGLGAANFEIVDAPFSFTMPGANRKAADEPLSPAPTDAPDAFEPAATPRPAFDTPRPTWKI